ncbi:site-specific integrase [Sphingomonas sp. Leaf242]|uniref:site-specific integrase n=1 Tax=Sphingomonas sp. Leaf242 TaxID=1736304 RepID=UPI001F46C162|nr:site-specific integrase [Sphingomonas sp. Leaf242]
MAHMAQPWKHPSTGFYYLRREIPTKLRPAFEGKAMWKVSLRTRDFSRAAVLFAGANAELEERFEEARKRFAESGDPRPSKRDQAVELVSSYFQGPPLDEGGLDGPERLLLCRLEVDRGLWNATPGGCSQVNISDDEEWWRLSGNAALFRGHRGTLRHLTDRAPGEIWRYPDHRFSTGARDIEIKRILTQVARHHGRAIDDLPDGTAEYISEYLDRLPVGPSQARKPQSAQSRLKPEMRLLELFEAWKEDTAPKAQTAHEYERAALDFIDFVGDIPVSEIVKNDLLNYRDEALKLPKSMPRKDRELPFTERVAKHASVTDGRVSAPTLKKRVGGIQALLSHAAEQRWIKSNEGRDVAISGYSKSIRKRRPFEEDELKQLLSSTLFLAPASWRMKNHVSDLTLYWLFLIALTTGARLEEVGQAALADVRISGSVTYIDIDDYTLEPGHDDAKAIKTEGSRRLAPIHDRLVDLGFNTYRVALAKLGHTRLFPDLTLNQFEKRTKEASRAANRYIDAHVSRDERLTFHSLRHGFKDFALEAGITERIVDQICGHAPTSVGGKYGNGVRLPVLYATLHRIDWTFIDWTALTAATADQDWEKSLTLSHVVGVQRPSST